MLRKNNNLSIGTRFIETTVQLRMRVLVIDNVSIESLPSIADEVDSRVKPSNTLIAVIK